MKKGIILILLLLTSLILWGCKSESVSTSNKAASYKSDKVVKIGYPSSGSDFLGGVAGLAQDKGYFKEELEKIGYTIEYFPFAGAGPAVNDAFVTGDVNFVMYADFPGIVLKSKGVDLDLLGVVSENANAQIVVKADSGIKSLSDLKGKKIGFPKGTYVQKYLIEALESVGIKQSDVEMINMTSEAQSGLLTGGVDALAYVDSLTQKLISTEKNIIAIDSTTTNKTFSGSSIFAGSHSYIEKNPEVTIAMFKALIRAREDAKKSPEEYYKILSERGQMPLEAVKKIHNLDSGKFEYIKLDITEDAIKKLESSKEFLLKTKLISDDFDVNSWVNNKYYKKALDEIEK